MKAKFRGGPLDGKVLETAGATYYVSPFPDGERADNIRYRRTRVTSTDEAPVFEYVMVEEQP